MEFCFDFQGRVFGPVDNGAPLFCIAGPCALESRAHALEVSAALREIFAAAGVSFIYKSSFDKANRSSGASFRGVGMTEGLAILAEVRERVGVPVLTDVHAPEQAAPVAEVADMLQTPAFLCRQTDLIAAHVHHQTAVAEARAALAQADALIARCSGLVQHVLHLPRGEKLAFLDVHGLAREHQDRKSVV